jgi:hypothetical protein
MVRLFFFLVEGGFIHSRGARTSAASTSTSRGGSSSESSLHKQQKWCPFTASLKSCIGHAVAALSWKCCKRKQSSRTGGGQGGGRAAAVRVVYKQQKWCVPIYCITEKLHRSWCALGQAPRPSCPSGSRSDVETCRKSWGGIGDRHPERKLVGAPSVDLEGVGAAKHEAAVGRLDELEEAVF